MDFYITKEEIVSSLNATLGVVEKRQTLPILANVLFEVDESTLRLTATDFCLLYTSPSPRDAHESRMPSSA